MWCSCTHIRIRARLRTPCRHDRVPVHSGQAVASLTLPLSPDFQSQGSRTVITRASVFPASLTLQHGWQRYAAHLPCAGRVPAHAQQRHPLCRQEGPGLICCCKGTGSLPALHPVLWGAHDRRSACVILKTCTASYSRQGRLMHAGDVRLSKGLITDDARCRTFS